ncbi:MAG: NAD(P)/FAD-dependent oxidoreductase [Wenzhouxiangellaceae bacterium]
MSSIIQTDVVIIGAGPVGLFQVFELGLLDLRAHVIDALPQVGGQCSELYPDKPIYDIPAIPVCGAQELIDRLMEQIKPFQPEFHLGQEVSTLQRQENGRFYLQTSKGTEFDTATVVIAAGLGAFQPRRLRAAGAAEYEERFINYRVKDPSRFHGRDLLILGGGDSALDWTLELCPHVNSLVLIHRRDEYRAQPASVRKMKQLCAEGKMQEMQGNVVAVHGDGERLRELEVLGPDGVKRRVEGEAVLVFWGLSPNLGPIADWGLELDKKQLRVDTEQFQTSEPGIFAVGDINSYPGKKKLILSGFHEAALAAFGIQKYLNPDKKVFLQYTTTSPVMHQRLGVETPAKK